MSARAEPRRTRAGILGLLAALPAGWFYLTKAVHIDDPVVLRAARNILVDPLRPFDGTIFWLSEPGSLFNVTTNPPLVSYWLAPWMALFGEREWVLHLAMLPFVAMVGLATAYFARRAGLGERAPWAVLVVVLGPALLPSVNLMRDVPMMGLWMGSLALWVEGLRRGSTWMLVAGAFAGGLAAVAKYTGALWILVAAAAVPGTERRRALGPLLLALVPLGAWCALSWHSYGHIHFLETGEKAATRERAAVVAAFFAGLGAMVPLWIARVGEKPARAAHLLAAALLFAGACRAATGAWPGPWFTLLGAGGILLGATTIGFVAGAGGGGGGLRGVLAAWLVVATLVPMFLVPFQAVRHLLVALPVVVIAGVARLRSERLVRASAGGILALGLVVQWSDWEIAGVYRDHFAALVRAAGPRPRWFVGSWGWQYYAERNGFRQILPTDAPPAGAAVAIPDGVFRGRLPPGLTNRLEQQTVLGYPARCPLRVMAWAEGAGYYSLGRLHSPFVLSRRQPLETFRVYRVKDAP